MFNKTKLILLINKIVYYVLLNIRRNLIKIILEEILFQNVKIKLLFLYINHLNLKVIKIHLKVNYFNKDKILVSFSLSFIIELIQELLLL